MACGVQQKCSERYTRLIRTYMILVLAGIAGIGAAAVWRYGVSALLVPAALSAVTLLGLLTLPELYASRLTYTRHRDWIMIEKGIIWRRTALIPRRQIQYVRLQRGPVERMFRLATLVLMTPGGRVCMHGLDQGEAGRLRRLIERG